jgi:hypothetical protein
LTPEQHEVPPALSEPSQHLEPPPLDVRSFLYSPPPDANTEHHHLYHFHRPVGTDPAPAADPDATVAIVFGRHRQDGTRGTRPAAPPPPRRRWIGRVAAALIPRRRRRAEQEEVA